MDSNQSEHLSVLYGSAYKMAYYTFGLFIEAKRTVTYGNQSNDCAAYTTLVTMDYWPVRCVLID